MRTLKSVLNQMTNVKDIIQDLKDTLREIDPVFPEEEDKFYTASGCLDQELKALGITELVEYFAARDEELAMELIYIGWQGFQLNQEIFRNPVNALLLNEDYEDIHLERRLCTLTTASKAREVQASFRLAINKLPEEKQYLMQTITEYYSYLQTIGYKIAYYFGFRLADQFLPYVVSGYVGDPVHTLKYLDNIEEYLQMNLTGMEDSKK